jgi:hypothetical protein
MSATDENGAVRGAAAQANPDQLVPKLVAHVYDIAPPVERKRMLEHLLQPMGVLAMVAIAGGVFAQLRFRSGWSGMAVRIEDLQDVRPTQVAELVEYVQQASIESVDGLAQLLAASPVVSGYSVTALLVAVLIRRAGRRMQVIDTARASTLPAD